MKIVQLFRSLLILLITFFSYYPYAFSQGIQCDTPPPEDSSYQAFINIITNGTGTLAGGVSGSVNYEIPIRLFIINDSDGTPPGSDLEVKAMEAVQGVNIRYTNGMSFFICEITYINNGQYFDDDDFANDLPQLYNFLFSQMGFADNAVAWVINNANSVNFGNFPWEAPRIVLTPRIASAGILAHELGHFFGLAHTFHNTTRCPQSGSNECIDRRVIIRPDCSCNPEESTFCGLSWICSGNPCDCENSGDKIADTPVDPGNDFCGFGWATNSPCIVETPGGQQLEYNPDYNNVMSYYNQNSFSPQQLNLMLLSLNHPNRTYLTDTNEPTCTEYVNPTALANVDRIRYNGSAWTSDPLPGASMNIRDNIIPVDYNKTTNANGEYQV